MMALLVQDEFPDADMNKVIHMCLIHDLGEAITGDIPAFEKTSAHEENEIKLLMDWISSFPEPYYEKFTKLYQEMEALQTEEAKIYKALDKLEAVIQHNHADISTWIPLEYELQFTYGEKHVEFSEYLKSLKEEIDHQTREKIEKQSNIEEQVI